MNYWLYDYFEDYQIWWWDYVEDGRIDYMDLAYLLDYWPDYFNFEDFASFASQWQKEIDERFYDDRPDLVPDGIIDFKDFAVLASEWGKTADAYPAISISVNGDSNNLRGEIGVSVTGCSYSTLKAYIFMDGQLLGESDYDDQQEQIPGITINTPSYLNGSHSLKCAVIDYNGLITLSEDMDVNFNNPLHCLNLEDTYEPNKSLRLLGLSATDNNLMVKLSKWDGEIIWSQQTTGDLDINIPGDVLAGQIYDVSIEQETTRLRLMDAGESWDTIYQRAITAIYDPSKPYQFAIILPNAYSFGFNSADCRKDAVAGIVHGCEYIGIKYIILYKDQCTWENFAKVLSKPTVFYAYVVSRIGVHGTTSWRTSFKISDGYVVSNLNTPLGGVWNGRSDVYSMASLGFGSTNKFKLVWIDVCYNGYGNYLGANDMARAWMDLSTTPILDKLYVSWNDAIFTSNAAVYANWSAFFWGNEDGFGIGGANSYQQAFTRAMIEVEDAQIVQRNAVMGKVGDERVKFTSHRYDY